MKLASILKSPWTLLVAALIVVAGVSVVLLQVSPEVSQNDLEVTQAHFTVAARLTEAILATQASAGSPEPVADSTPEPEVTQPAETPTATVETQTLPDDPKPLSPSPTLPCDQAAPGIPMDVTIPDESAFLPGQLFTKVWRLQNIGTCAWTGDYAIRFFYGDRMGAAETIYLGSEVIPGELVDIAVDMQAPNEPGSYQGNWKMLNARGQLFGIGPKGDAPFWVNIVVLRVATMTFTPTITPTPTTTSTPPVTSTATPTSTPPVQSMGELTLELGQSVDLDSGTTNPQSGKDLNYALNNSFHVLQLQNQAILGIYGSAQPGLEACRGSALSQAPIALESLASGMHLCYQTEAGRFGWLRYGSLNEDGSAEFTYQTWANP